MKKSGLFHEKKAAVSVILWHEHGRSRPVCLGDDPEYRSLGGAIRGEKAKALFEG
jgi:hypothetical protein